MGSKTWTFVVFVGVIVYQWYPVTEHNILVLVNSNTFDVSKLAQVKNLKAAFKIDANIDDHMKKNSPSELEARSKWNLALIIKNEIDGKHGKLRLHSGNDEILDDVLSKTREQLLQHDFINQVAQFPYTENLSLTKLYNLGLSTVDWFATNFPFYFKINFTIIKKKDQVDHKLVEKLCGQKAINAGGRKRMVMVNVMKVNDSESWKKYENAMMKYLPQIGTTIFSRGVADSEYWDDVALVTYRSRAKFCEMAISEEVKEVAPYKQKGLSNTHTYMTYQIIECSKRINGCAPTDD